MKAAFAFIFFFVLVRVSAGRVFRLNQVQEGASKLPLCVGVLVFQGANTLERTLSTNRGLFQIIEEPIAFFQQINSPERRRWAREVIGVHGPFSSLFATQNVGQREAFRLIAEACSQPYIVILEEDFRAAKHADFFSELTSGISHIQQGAHAVRLRSRRFPGSPNYIHEAWLNSGGHNGGVVRDTHLIEYVTWHDSPETFVPQLQVCRQNPKTWCTSSKHAQYTNNPTLYSTDFLRDLISKVPTHGDVHFEAWLTEFWSKQSYKVVYSDGLFTHERTDRTLGTISDVPPDSKTASSASRLAPCATLSVPSFDSLEEWRVHGDAGRARPSTGIHPEGLKPFILSLRKNGYEDSIVMATSRLRSSSEEARRRAFFKENNVLDIKLLNHTLFEHRFGQSICRYEFYEQVASKADLDSVMLVSDTKDVFFQGNPFTSGMPDRSLAWQTHSSLLLFAEDTLLRTPWCEIWLTEIYGTRLFNS